MKKFKKLIALLLAFVLVFSVSTSVFAGTEEEYSDVELPFTDVKDSDWFANYVKQAYSCGWVNGKTATIFDPNGKITRADFAVILYRYINWDCNEGEEYSTDYSKVYSDVKFGQYYTDAIMWCSNAGLITGYTSGANKGKFGVTDQITREQIATVLLRAEKAFWGDEWKEYPEGTLDKFINGVSLASYADAKSVSGFAEKGMKYACGTKIISGKPRNGKTYLDPQGKATRAEVCTMISRFNSASY